MAEKIVFNWSGGKDSAMAVYEIMNSEKPFEIISLLTTLTGDYDRISMHGVRRELLEKQAESLSIPLDKIYITKNGSNEDYENALKASLSAYKKQGVSTVAFGDIFLEDLKKYREDNLAKVSMSAIFPIWKKDTTYLANKFINVGFKNIITCVDTKYLDKDFAGRNFDEQFLADLPDNVDPCGENGEFHSFVYDGPIFQNRIPFKKGEIVLRDKRFYYCDLLPV